MERVSQRGLNQGFRGSGLTRGGGTHARRRIELLTQCCGDSFLLGERGNRASPESNCCRFSFGMRARRDSSFA